MDSLILEDRYGKHYRLRLPGEVFFPHVSIDHKKFHDRLSALCFIQGLRYDAFRWRYVLNAVIGQPLYLRENEILEAIAAQIERGRIKVYPIPHLTRSASPVQYPVGEARGGIRYRFIPASMLLTNSLRDVRIFHSKDDAERFVQSLQWTNAGSEAIPKTDPRPTADSSSRARREKTDDLIDKMAKGEIVVVQEIVSATPPEPIVVESSASGSGNRPMTLGPHVGSEEGSTRNTRESISPRHSDLKSMDPEYLGEETGKVWGTKVKYLNEAERQQYKLSVKDGRLFDSSGNPFDTSGASSVFSGGKGSAIYVMDGNGNIFASKTQTVGKFHHSSFLAGEPVASAGEITVKDGYIKAITRRSGHYQPTEAQSNQLLTQLRTNGVDMSGIVTKAGFY